MAKTKTPKNEGSAINRACGLILSISRTRRLLKRNSTLRRLSPKATVMAAAFSEYIVRDLITAAKTELKPTQTFIRPRHLMAALRGNKELAHLLGSGSFPSSGVLPSRLHPLQLSKRQRRALAKKEGK